jgi:signal transduction histidine kinase
MLGGDNDERRLRLGLVALFLALAVPTGAVLWQAYGQLKWEAFHQYRTQAEELTARIDSTLAERVANAESRSFAEFSFLNIEGDPGAGFLQRSPLSQFPVPQEIPGAIGYFQVDDVGRFSSPLLPAPEADAAGLGIGDSEFQARSRLEREIRDVLVGNSLAGGQEISQPSTQALFDQINQAPPTAANAASPAPEEAGDLDRASQYSKVSELKFDDAFQKKSQSVEGEALERGAFEQAEESQSSAGNRLRRTERAALPEPADSADKLELEERVDQDLRVSTFESAIDPFEFGMLESGEFVLFRKVWREGERYVQGVLLDRDAFLNEAIISAFRTTVLSEMSDLVVAFGEDVIQVVQAEDSTPGTYPSSEMAGELLYQGRLSSPLGALELIFSVKQLPAGPGASVLRWTTILLISVFGLGFMGLYRLGLGQIRLARQQQDFVSSVSHELKTPLTSIRMYSEMLKEGWADEARKEQYYAFIHDESERLSRLITNVLQLASITRNEPRFELEPRSLAELMDLIRSKIASQVERAGFELFMELEGPGEASIEIDEDCLMQIVINLVDNAIKFSRGSEQARIEIRAGSGSKGMARISVRDFGPGIPREQMKKIFRLFYRPQSELTRETVGTGIGLAIVHQLALAMHGRVDVVNVDPGAEFGVEFPLRKG